MKVRFANRFVHRRPTAGMCATSQVEDHACDGRRRRHHVLIRIRRSKEGRPLADSHKAWLRQAGFAASLPYRRLKQRAQGTAATASVPAVPATRRRNHWNQEPPAQRLWREAPQAPWNCWRRRRKFQEYWAISPRFGPSKMPIFKRFRLRFSYFQKPERLRVAT